MATEAQIQANRANAKKSCGPKTDAGKARSRLNGLTHGLRAKNAHPVLPQEDPADLEAKIQEWIDDYQPTSAVERELVSRAARLSWTLDRAERHGPKSLNDAELLALPGLYRSALSSLSVARAISLDRALVTYLEGLASRGYFFVYGSRGRTFARIAGFFANSWPRSVQRMWPDVLAAALIMTLAAVAKKCARSAGAESLRISRK